ncbi:hypothetical protein CEV32_1721 [Brucella rhizosphaerae]|uniref:Uncharacterized protein n=1 Tax=Brucella rhizosphaerae TaxID=571254 RepID=A0A256F380_9HYPH|nr:hypothetical protein CEV32_1721 [Brucella rhizosphaerae]
MPVLTERALMRINDAFPAKAYRHEKLIDRSRSSFQCDE